jgi:hypothetical protein
MAIPLKINNAGGTEIKQFTTAEENYIAYQIGLHLAADSANGDGTITSNSSHTSIGSYTNTFFNEAVGTHPSTSITTGSTTTPVYQNQTSAIETDSDIETPIMWVDSGGETGFKQMPTGDLNAAVDRYISTIFTNDYPGTFKLASSSPGVDYSVHISSAFTDTRTDGTSIAYNIYRRDSYTAPTAIRPLYVRDNGGFDGIQAMNDRQIKYSFGQRAKTRIGASKIGTYQLRSSAQGAPTDPGTWVTAGAATDTKQTTSDVVYVRDSTTNFATQYTKNYTNSYDTSYVEAYIADYEKTFTSQYERIYTQAYNVSYIDGLPLTVLGMDPKVYTGVGPNYYVAVEGYVADYEKAFIPGGLTTPVYAGSSIYYVNTEYTSTQVYTNSSFADPAGTYLNTQIYINALYDDFGQQVVQYGRARMYTNTQMPTFSPFVDGPTGITISPGDPNSSGYINTFDGPGYIPDDTIYDRSFTALYQSVFVAYYVGNYEKSLIYNNAGTLYSAGPVIYDSTGFQQTVIYTKQYTGQYQPPVYIGQYDRNVITRQVYYTGGYAGAVQIAYTRGVSYQGVIVRNDTYTAFARYSTLAPRFYQGSVGTGNLRSYQISLTYTRSSNIAQFYLTNVVYSGNGPELLYTQRYTKEFLTTNFYEEGYVTGTGNYTSASPAQIGNYTTILYYLGSYSATALETFQNFYAPIYSGQSYLGDYAGDTPGVSYDISYLSVFDPPEYNTVFTRQYTGGFAVTNYAGSYTIDYQGLYENIYTNVFLNSYISNYDAVFDNFFYAQYQQDYLGNFEGNFAGETIQASNQTEETYTLYVRIG